MAVKKTDRRTVMPRKNHTGADRTSECEYCWTRNHSYLYHLLWIKCPSCGVVTPTALLNPLYLLRDRNKRHDH